MWIPVASDEKWPQHEVTFWPFCRIQQANILILDLKLLKLTACGRFALQLFYCWFCEGQKTTGCFWAQKSITSTETKKHWRIAVGPENWATAVIYTFYTKILTWVTYVNLDSWGGIMLGLSRSLARKIARQTRNRTLLFRRDFSRGEDTLKLI